MAIEGAWALVNQTPGFGGWAPPQPPGPPFAYSPPHRVHGRTFAIVVGIVIGLCGLVVTIFMLLSRHLGAESLSAVLAALPAVALIGAYMWLDRYEPEPRSLLLLSLGWGAFVAAVMAVVLELGGHLVASSAAAGASIFAPIAEEGMKGLFLFLLFWFRRDEMDGFIDAIVYAGMVGIGFAFTENIEYLTAAQAGSHGGVALVVLFIVRCVLSPFAHPLFTTFTALGIGLALTKRSRAVRIMAPIVGLILAICAHGTWNFSLVLGVQVGIVVYVLIMLPAFGVVAGFAIWARKREGRFLHAALYDAATRFGLLPAVEVPWLVNLKARRFCRKTAAATAGKAAGKTMADYQREAISMAYLHHRYLHGVAPKGYQERVREHRNAMNALRPRLIWPTYGSQTSGARAYG